MSQYDEEHYLYNNKAFHSKEFKERLEVNFLDDHPPMLQKDWETGEGEDGQAENKFE